MSVREDYVAKYGEIAGAVFRPGHTGAIMELRTLSPSSPQGIADELSEAGVKAVLVDKSFGQAVAIMPGRDHQNAFRTAIDVMEEKGHMKPDTANDLRNNLEKSVALVSASRDANQGRGGRF